MALRGYVRIRVEYIQLPAGVARNDTDQHASGEAGIYVFVL